MLPFLSDTGTDRSVDTRSPEAARFSFADCFSTGIPTSELSDRNGIARQSQDLVNQGLLGDLVLFDGEAEAGANETPMAGASTDSGVPASVDAQCSERGDGYTSPKLSAVTKLGFPVTEPINQYPRYWRNQPENRSDVCFQFALGGESRMYLSHPKPTGESWKIGDAIVYGRWDVEGRFCPTHAAVVSAVSKEGYATEVTSKIGKGEVVMTAPADLWLTSLFGNPAIGIEAQDTSSVRGWTCFPHLEYNSPSVYPFSPTKEP